MDCIGIKTRKRIILDKNILCKRSDIDGIIRISDEFFYKNKSEINKVINYAVKKIKSKSSKKIKFY